MTIDAQLEAVLQANVNLQFAGADAEATSGAVYVTSAGELEAADHGINAQSNAAASADLDQSADQENNNEVTADGTLVLQGQLLGQVNLNVQGAVADADATSGPVTVEQDGVLNVGGDGITAESNAAASASLEQTADQDNSNSATATLETPDVPVLLGEDPSI